MKFKSAALILSVLILSSCASISNSLDANRARNVQKVAIVAFEINQERATDNLGISGFKALNEGEDKDSKELQTMAINVANNFSSQIQSKTQWKVTPIKDMINNSAYKAKYQTAMTGAREVMMSNFAKSYVVNPKGILDVMAFRKMTLEERKTLAMNLGVDALAEVVVFNSMHQSMYSLGHISGDAAFAYSGRANLQVYGLDSTDPIWRSQNVEGEKTEKSDELSEKLSKREKISILGEKASYSAIEKLVGNYKL
jgi:hypothetical protein